VIFILARAVFRLAFRIGLPRMRSVSGAAGTGVRAGLGKGRETGFLALQHEWKLARAATFHCTS